MGLKVYVNDVLTGLYAEGELRLKTEAIPIPIPTPLPTPQPLPTPVQTTGINITTTGRVPLYLTQSVLANGAVNYYIVTDKLYSKVTFSLESQDWDATDMDLMVGLRPPTRKEMESLRINKAWVAGPEVWGVPALARSNETVFIKQTLPAKTVIYATVANFNPQIAGRFRISWSAY